jgi:hypothetical protein
MSEKEKDKEKNSVVAPTLDPAPTRPTYDTSTWDSTSKGSGALGAYNSAKDAVTNYGDFTYGNKSQLDNIINSILNREKFSYDLNGDALYQQYKDKYIQQGKMAMGDAIGQASAMTGGYGNSYAQSVGQQMYQKELQNLNDIVPELWQMALDKYNMEGQDLYNQYGMLSDDYNREYGAWNDEYGRTMDAYNIASDAYYKGADMFYTEQNNKNNVAGSEFDDAMDIWKANTNNSWKEAEWDRDNERYKDEYNINYGYLNTDNVKLMQTALGVNADGDWGPVSTAAAGGLTVQQAWTAYLNGTLKNSGGTTGGTSGGSGSTGNGSTGNSSNSSTGNTNKTELNATQKLQQKLGVTADGDWGPKSQYAACGLSAEEAQKAATRGVLYSRSEVEGTLNDLIASGAKKSEINSALRDLLNQGSISQAVYNELKSIYAPVGSTYR